MREKWVGDQPVGKLDWILTETSALFASSGLVLLVQHTTDFLFGTESHGIFKIALFNGNLEFSGKTRLFTLTADLIKEAVCKLETTLLQKHTIGD